MIRPDGEARVLRSIGRAAPGKDGTAVHIHGVVIDVTENARPEGIQDAQELLEMLRVYAEQFERHSGISVEVVAGNPAAGLDPRTVRVLFWIAQEALHNVARHARAHRAVVEFECEAGLATLTVRDDGIGFAPESQAKSGSGMALTRERPEARGRGFWIESAPGNRTPLAAAPSRSQRA